MCGIIAIINKENNANIDVYEGLQALQHRGQDSCGIANENLTINYSGLVKNSFNAADLTTLNSKIAIGHVRYATNSSINANQPIYYPNTFDIYGCHNGNIINTKGVRGILKVKFNITLDENTSDSKLLIILFTEKLLALNNTSDNISDSSIQKTFEFLSETVLGSYNLAIIIKNYGLIIHRDLRGIRPLIWGNNNNSNIVTSESVSLSLLNCPIKRDVKPGETIVFKENNSILHFNTRFSILSPCLFEYIYFARQDSYIDSINVTQARLAIGALLGNLILEKYSHLEIDMIIPVPDTSMTFALGAQSILKKPIGEGFIKNRYIDRTFIMKNHDVIRKNIKRKLSPNEFILKNKNLLIIDDSVVRGNTSKHIVKLARECNCKNIYFASCAPIIKNINNYGIYIPTQKELLSHNNSLADMAKILDVDELIFNDLYDIIHTLKLLNLNINSFETSMFT